MTLSITILNIGMPSVVILNGIYAECRKLTHYAVCHYPECHYAECRYVECRGVDWKALQG